MSDARENERPATSTVTLTAAALEKLPLYNVDALLPSQAMSDQSSADTAAARQQRRALMVGDGCGCVETLVAAT